MRRGRVSGASPSLVAQIERAEAEVAHAQANLVAARSRQAPLPERRAAHARLSRAFADADTALRTAVSAAKAESSISTPGSFVAWSRWRKRLSRMSSARQNHLHEQIDDLGVLLPCSVRAVDTGMLGPAIGELQYGRSKPPGSPARIGVDLVSVLDGGLPSPPRPLPTTTASVPEGARRGRGGLTLRAAPRTTSSTPHPPRRSRRPVRLRAA